ncbi:MAG: hypothetical protein KDA89_16965 [Planctomycetaceae bacterium]|nr:hypothetical protein [Planctomycetaceae bacterium]
MIALFVLKLSAGIACMWWLMPRREVTDGFFRIQMRVVLGLSVLAALLLSSGTTWNDAVAEQQPAADISVPAVAWSAREAADRLRILAMAGAVVSYFGTVFWALGRRLPGNICIHLLAAFGLLSLILHAASVPSPAPVALRLLATLSTAGVLGSVLTGMLLGHWYLTTPTMSIRPLYWFNKSMVVSAILRCAASVWTLTTTALPTGDVTQEIWLGIRWLGGIAAPLAAAYMVWQILKHRNTQSATGVLFAALILVFMGEMAAALLEGSTLMPW